MVIRLCKLKMDVKPKLYASLDIIPAVGMNGSKSQSTALKMDSYNIKLVQTVQNGQKQ